MDKAMQKALEADGDKLRALTGGDHGPFEPAVGPFEEGVTVAAGRPTITIPAPTPDQAVYLATILAASKYDPRVLIGGPKGGHCKEGDHCVCGGDTPEVRAGCHNWVSAAASPWL